MSIKLQVTVYGAADLRLDLMWPVLLGETLFQSMSYSLQIRLRFLKADDKAFCGV